MTGLRIARSLVEAIVDHAHAEHPNEACGIVAGPAGTDTPVRHIAMANAEHSPTRYAFDPAEQITVWAELDERGEDPVVLYHSHPATAAHPSLTDIHNACEPDAHYLIVSTRGPVPEVRSYRITDGRAVEEQVVTHG